jgi:hypothetical protein
MGTTSGALCHSTGEDPGGRVIKLAPVVALDDFDLPAELIRHISKEIGQSGECVRFKL